MDVSGAQRPDCNAAELLSLWWSAPKRRFQAKPPRKPKLLEIPGKENVLPSQVLPLDGEAALWPCSWLIWWDYWERRKWRWMNLDYSLRLCESERQTNRTADDIRRWCSSAACDGAVNGCGGGGVSVMHRWINQLFLGRKDWAPSNTRGRKGAKRMM